ncbi:MAG: hypothetical protein ACI83N_001399 [Hydrogenophaga sp.]|jgi:hypothetical protein
MMPRVVTHEALDDLDERDPMAVRSRHDLQRVHLVMGTRAMVVRAIRSACAGHPRTAALHVLELGAGDGSLMLGVARQLADEWTDVRLTLLERQGIVTPPTLAAYKAAGWSAQACVADALAWADGDAKPGPCPPPSGGRWDLVIANLFLHHFEGAALIKLLGGIEHSADRFIACEPARSRLALAGSHLIGFTGAGPVTREDAVLSVHAGFRADEISAAWPGVSNVWDTTERSAGLFSHCFVAQRRGLAKTMGARVP